MLLQGYFINFLPAHITVNLHHLFAQLDNVLRGLFEGKISRPCWSEFPHCKQPGSAAGGAKEGAETVSACTPSLLLCGSPCTYPSSLFVPPSYAQTGGAPSLRTEARVKTRVDDLLPRSQNTHSAASRLRSYFIAHCAARCTARNPWDSAVHLPFGQ